MNVLVACECRETGEPPMSWLEKILAKRSKI